MANEISRGIIAKITKIDSGPAYERAVGVGTAYWLLLLDGKDVEGAQQEYDRALSELLGCTASVSGQRMGLLRTLKKRFLGIFQ